MEQGHELQFYLILTSLGFLGFIIFIVFLVLFFQKRKVQFLLQEEKNRLNFENELIKVKDEIREQNLNDVSRELHDNIGQILTVASLELNMLQNKQIPTVLELSELSSLVDRSLSELRSLASMMNTDRIESVGLVGLMKRDLDRTKKNMNIDYLIKDGLVFVIDHKRALIVYRIFQECLTNCIKYAKAQNIAISMSDSEKFIIFTFADDGIGFDPLTTNKGNGIDNIDKRARMLAGHCTIESKNGTSITIKFLKGNHEVSNSNSGRPHLSV